MWRKLVLAVVSALATMAVHASQEQAKDSRAQETSNRERQELYAGVVLDQTITVAGHEFYQYFAAVWRDKEMSERFAISVHEHPSARQGSRIWIEYAQRRVFQAVLQATRANMKEISREAAEVAFQNVMDIEVDKLIVRDADLAADEI